MELVPELVPESSRTPTITILLVNVLGLKGDSCGVISLPNSVAIAQERRSRIGWKFWRQRSLRLHLSTHRSDCYFHQIWP